MGELRTTLYDIRGYFIPGSITLWAFLEWFALASIQMASPVYSSLPPSIKVALFVIVAYALGHVLHAIANITIDKLPFASYPPKDYFDEKFQKDFPQENSESLKNAIAEMLKISPVNPTDSTNFIKSSYWHCFQFVMSNKNVETENFLGLTGFYRGMASAMLVISLLYTVEAINSWNGGVASIAFSTLIASCLFLARAKRFNYYLVKTVYSNFVSLHNAGKQTIK